VVALARFLAALRKTGVLIAVAGASTFLFADTIF